MGTGTGTGIETGIETGSKSGSVATKEKAGPGTPPMVLSARYVVLRERFAEERVGRFAVELGWSRQWETTADPDEGISYAVGWGVGTLSVEYCEDDVSRHSYLCFAGEDAAAVEGATELAEARLDAWRVEDLLTAVDSETEPVELARAVIRAGLGAPRKLDERFFAVIDGALQHPDARVREAAVWAVSYVPQPQYRRRLEALRDHDPEYDVWSTAQILLDAFDAEGVGGQRA
ncbi:hypothetical protein C8K30_106336 [Promicromonospora sp. AC04]|uniref:HEAT repeat domain-containing protein n=1 Tax=Promicromonospora sp. AC04 TaxID=2135723 RepID=UPI000D351A62|nr:HEAT repeat domain-containing protein [Promicromonospora sp. AC04]PUB26247.1 hypothetical protein C8K30_106336 [Promicromonospora sp. AC04]